MKWWLSSGDKPEGPFPAEPVTEWLKSGRISPDTMACPEGGQDWKRLDEIDEFAQLVPPPSPPSEGPPPPPPHLSAPIEQPVPAKPPPGSPPSKLLRFEYSLVAIVAVLLVWSLLVNPSQTLGRLALRGAGLAAVAAIVWLAHRHHWIETVLKVGAYVWIVLGILTLVLAVLVIVLVQFAG